MQSIANYPTGMAGGPDKGSQTVVVVTPQAWNWETYLHATHKKTFFKLKKPHNLLKEKFIQYDQMIQSIRQ